MTTQTEDSAPIEYLPNGKILVYLRDMEDNEIVYNLRVPRFKEFKAIKAALFEANDKIRAKGEELGIGAVNPNDPVALAEYAAIAEELLDETYDHLVVVIRLAFDLLNTGDAPLPEDDDDWPAWLVTDQEPIAKMLTHWKTVPLGRG